ncbi:MAG: RnfABCDGE type electron transport complex subunit E [Lachnospiraceae bacterium]|nr:electron transport complex subunit E [Lachnospiraceae bacterium]MDD6618285.1 electron transport complex subunit E [Clostridiales bacterium]MDY4769638.1 electron transport complex subunit E [Lachnospiraceae bacterium]
MKPNSPSERLYNGIIKENPTFVLLLGMCPTLAVTTSAMNGLGMGLTTMVILALSNMFISMLRKVIPDTVRVPAFIVVVASFVTIVQFLLEGFIPSLYDSLGIYIPLIVVNCIILGRAEAYASKNGVISSLFDGIGMGLGFTLGLTCIGIVRELFGAGQIFGFQIMPSFYTPITIFILAPGAFFVLAFLVAFQNKMKIGSAKKGIDPSNSVSCGGGCASCGNSACKGKRG